MSVKIDRIKRGLKGSLEDRVMSGRERTDLRKLIAGEGLTDQEQKLLLSKVRDLALRQIETQNDLRIMEWFYEAVKVVNSARDEAPSPPGVYFSPGNGCRDAICQHIRTAKKSVSICVFTISDNIIAEEILAAHREGKSVRIITDNDKVFDMGSDIEMLDKRGVKVRTDRTDVHMHHKFAIIDGEYLINGSYNWTRSAAERNYENILITQEASLVRAYNREFERLWKKLS